MLRLRRTFELGKCRTNPADLAERLRLAPEWAINPNVDHERRCAPVGWPAADGDGGGLRWKGSTESRHAGSLRPGRTVRLYPTAQALLDRARK